MIAPRPLILVMDDRSLVINLARAQLEAAGYDVCSVTSVAELRQLRMPRAPALMVFDVQMPEAPGDVIAAAIPARAARRSARRCTPWPARLPSWS